MAVRDIVGRVWVGRVALVMLRVERVSVWCWVGLLGRLLGVKSTLMRLTLDQGQM